MRVLRGTLFIFPHLENTQNMVIKCISAKGVPLGRLSSDSLKSDWRKRVMLISCYQTGCFAAGIQLQR
jgi:hypothetical protein